MAAELRSARTAEAAVPTWPVVREIVRPAKKNLEGGRGVGPYVGWGSRWADEGSAPTWAGGSRWADKDVGRYLGWGQQMGGRGRPPVRFQEFRW
jgi:hypothetical protein